jgi:hypothetical protein
VALTGGRCELLATRSVRYHLLSQFRQPFQSARAWSCLYLGDPPFATLLPSLLVLFILGSKRNLHSFNLDIKKVCIGGGELFSFDALCHSQGRPLHLPSPSPLPGASSRHKVVPLARMAVVGPLLGALAATHPSDFIRY